MPEPIRSPLPWWKTPWVMWNAAALVALGGLLGYFLLRHSSDLQFVREARLEGFPDEPLGEVLDQFLADPQWAAGRDDKGQSVVTVSGRVRYLGATTAVVHFRVDRERGSLAPSGLELDGRAKNTLVQSDFLRRAYANFEKVLLRR